MKVYTVGSWEPYGTDVMIESIWDSKEAAEVEMRRIAPKRYGVEVKEYEVQSDLVCKGEILDSKVSGV